MNGVLIICDNSSSMLVWLCIFQICSVELIGNAGSVLRWDRWKVPVFFCVGRAFRGHFSDILLGLSFSKVHLEFWGVFGCTRKIDGMVVFHKVIVIQEVFFWGLETWWQLGDQVTSINWSTDQLLVFVTSPLKTRPMFVSLHLTWFPHLINMNMMVKVKISKFYQLRLRDINP